MTIVTAPRRPRLVAILIVLSLLTLAVLWAAAYFRPSPRVPQRTTIIRSEPGLVRRAA
ncbi:MAG: hypothetical protein ACYC6I_00845 [Bacillota bacterium]